MSTTFNKQPIEMISNNSGLLELKPEGSTGLPLQSSEDESDFDKSSDSSFFSIDSYTHSKNNFEGLSNCSDAPESVNSSFSKMPTLPSM